MILFKIVEKKLVWKPFNHHIKIYAIHQIHGQELHGMLNDMEWKRSITYFQWLVGGQGSLRGRPAPRSSGPWCPAACWRSAPWCRRTASRACGWAVRRCFPGATARVEGQPAARNGALSWSWETGGRRSVVWRLPREHLQIIFTFEKAIESYSKTTVISWFLQ